jgi:MATE family multidrug resistance protein
MQPAGPVDPMTRRLPGEPVPEPGWRPSVRPDRKLRSEPDDTTGQVAAKRARRDGPSRWTDVVEEARSLAGLALPVVGTQIGTMLMGTVDTWMVARVGVQALAAAALANAWIYGLLLAGQGVIHGMDPIVTQAHGAGRGEQAGLALQRGLALSLLLSLPIALLWLHTEDFLLLLGQDPALARAAQEYTRVQIPSIPCFLAFVALRQYLQGRELVRPAMWVILAANLFNAFANWVLIFGKLGLPALGLVGAGIATSLSRVVIAVGLALWIARFGLHRGAWTRWSRAALAPRAVASLLAVGLPVAVQMSLEIWAFSLSTLLAGRLGAAALSAHTIVLNMAALSFMMPLGVAQGAVTRVGNLLGARQPGRAQRAAWVSLCLGAGVMGFSALAFVTLRHQLPRLYTDDASVLALGAAILPIAAAFQVFDGTQVVGCGVLRGMGRTRPAAWFNLLGYWALGLPLAAWLALRGSWGLPGIWWGLCAGLAVVASLLVARIHLRGPARDGLRLA